MTYGLSASDAEHLPTKEKMVLLAIDEISQNGPADFNANVVCDRLGIRHPMVQYHFGSRDGLLAEATMYANNRWIEHVARSLNNAPVDPKKRLLAFIDSEIAYANQIGGMNVLLHYPISSKGSQILVAEKYGEELQKNFEYSLSMLTHIIVGLRSGQAKPFDFDITNYPRLELVIKHPAEFLAATQVAWATHGLASWSNGNHIATRELSKMKLANLSIKVAIDAYKKSILAIALGK